VATSTKGVQGDRAYNWMKVYHLRTFMKHYDWILALDSDSYVHGFNMSIEYALRRFTGDEMFTGEYLNSIMKEKKRRKKEKKRTKREKYLKIFFFLFSRGEVHSICGGEIAVLGELG